MLVNTFKCFNERSWPMLLGRIRRRFFSSCQQRKKGQIVATMDAVTQTHRKNNKRMQRADLSWHFTETSLFETQLDERRHLADGGGQTLERIEGEVELAQLIERAQLERKRRDLVI